MKRVSGKQVDTQDFKAFLQMVSFISDFTADAVS